MAKDFRASQIQTTQIISSGSSGTNARIVMYDVSGQSTVQPNQGIIDSSKFSTGSIGEDIFLYVSGGVGERNLDRRSIACFGGDVHISGNLSIDGTGQSLFRLEVVDYATTTNTSSSPQIVGQVIFPANEFSGSLNFRAVLSTTNAATTASVRLFNLTSGAYVELAPGQDALTTTNLAPTIVESQDLFAAVNFTTGAQAIYELHLHTANAADEVLVGGGELRPTGSFTGLTIVTSSVTTITGVWIDNNNRLRTTASVAIDSDGNFADNFGSNNYFYVSGTINSWTTSSALTNKSHSVFGGDVRISGSFIGGSGSEIFDNFPVGTGSATPYNFIAGGTDHKITPFSNGQELFGTQVTARNFIGAGFSNTVTQSSDSAVVSGRFNQIFEGVLSGGFIGAGRENTVIGNDSAIVAGWDNTAGANRAFVGAGRDNFASGEDSFVGGGRQNGVAIGATYSAIVAGYANNIPNNEEASIIGAGQFNSVDADNAAIVGGYNNNIDNSANMSFIGAGQNNNINSFGSSMFQAVLVGSGNQIQGFSSNATNYSVILGGARNLINQSASLLYGFDLTGSFSEGNTIQFGSRTSSRPYRFVVSASRGSVFHGGLSGSLTTLEDGSPYLIAGSNITLTTGSSGEVTIAATGGGGGGGGDLQNAYNSGSDIVVNTLTGSISVTGNPGTNLPLIRLAPSHVSDEQAIDIRDSTDSTDLIRLYGNGTTFGGGTILLKSQGSFPSSIIWSNAASISRTSGNFAGIRFFDANDRLEIFDSIGAGSAATGEVAIIDEGGTGGELATFMNANVSNGGIVNLLPAKALGRVHNSASFYNQEIMQVRGGLIVDSGSQLAVLTDYGRDVSMVVSGTVGGKGTAGQNVGLFLGDVHISGNLTVDGTFPSGGGGSSFFFSNIADRVETTGSLYVTGALVGNDSLVVGNNNTNSTGLYVAIAGGQNHEIVNGISGSVTSSAILGGETNIISGSDSSVILGGFGSTLDEADWSAIIGGGNLNVIRGAQQSVIGGGFNNRIDSLGGIKANHGWDAIFAGEANRIIGGPSEVEGYNVLAGGFTNTINGSISTFIGAGQFNNVYRSNNSAIFGDTNVVTGSTVTSASFVLGSNNTLTNTNETIVAGFGISTGLSDHVYIGGGTSRSTRVVVSASSGMKVSASIELEQGVRYRPTFVTASRTLVTSEYIVGVSASAALTLTLPGSPTNGQAFIVKDAVGNAVANNIIVSSSGDQIDGASTYTIAINYGSAQFVYFSDASSWGVI